MKKKTRVETLSGSLLVACAALARTYGARDPLGIAEQVTREFQDVPSTSEAFHKLVARVEELS